MAAEYFTYFPLEMSFLNLSRRIIDIIIYMYFFKFSSLDYSLYCFMWLNDVD